ncbi:bifunctional precorrin-2 dehydrogenase/sirohydrochlorin ferrochelatase [Clostridiaceae bacterium]|nr:bifunctional precorrin-2 dehydrogenase/sirohydrochlorin ferrochelatase [Clostridiaceae bacterium]
MAYFPLFMDMSRRRVLIVGGGGVALRRIRVLEEFGAELVVAAEDAREEIVRMAAEGRLTLVRGAYQDCRARALEMGPFFLVLAATGDGEADALAEADGRDMGALVNVAGDRSRCDFYFPGIARKGDLTVGITGQGRDHAGVAKAAQAVRELLEGSEEERNTEE